jgi:hypothetical protein
MRFSVAVFVAVILTAAAAGCGSGGPSGTSATTAGAPATTSAPASTTAAASTAAVANGAGALQAEAKATAAGDIPDNQVFLVFRDARAGYSMKYPEGWAQRGAGDSVSFRDKNNIIRAVVSAGSAWTRGAVLADVRSLKGARVQGPPQAITLSGRPAFKVVYRTVSAPNPVTGKRVTLSVDRYYVGRQGRRAVLDLGSPVGVDNVDAYRLISQSFRWS